MVNGMDLLVKMAQFCFMDDLCNVLMCCLYDVKTNLHNSTASEAGLFFKAYLKTRSLGETREMTRSFSHGQDSP